MRRRSDKMFTTKKIIRRQPVADREIDFSIPIEYSPPIKTDKNKIKASKSFKDVPQNSYLTLFVRKCEECSHIFDFQNIYLFKSQIEIKSTLLIQLFNGFDNPHLCHLLGPPQFNSFLEMIRKNIFRALPNLYLQDFDANDINWPHLNLVYSCLKKSLFLGFYNNISRNFIYNLLKNVASYDKRERICVRDITIEPYARYAPVRSIIYRCVLSLLSINICSNEFFQIIASISAKSKFFNSQFFIEYIMPMHLLPKCVLYQSLIDCDLIFVRKDSNMFPILFQYLLNHWPVTIMKKYSFFLKAIVKLFELFLIDNNGKISENYIITSEMANAYFDVISLCSCSEYAETAAYALHLISQPLFKYIYRISLIDDNEEYEYDNDCSEEKNYCSFMKICQSVIISENHWDEGVRSCALDAKLALSTLNHVKFEKIRRTIIGNKAGQNSLVINKYEIDERWKIIFGQAKRRYRSININIQ